MKRLPRNSGKKVSPALNALAGYGGLLGEIKRRIRAAQVRAAFATNAEMLRLYWDVGRLLAGRQKLEGWGAAVLPRLARDIGNELPDVKGFSERNLKRMVQFFHEYPALFEIGPPPVAQLPANATPGEIRPPAVAQLETTAIHVERGQQLVARLTWAHNIILIEKVKELTTRYWYARQTLEQGWSRDVLALMIQNRAHVRQGKAVTNFIRTLPQPQSDFATQLLKDPYIFDFLTLEKSFHERELETGLLRHLQDFLVELGAGFAFVGRQVHLNIGGDDFYLDLLFYHLRLRCFVVIDLKVGPFRAEYAGKMNLYLNAVDDRMRHDGDQPGIGIILCQDKNRVVAEYALRGMKKAIGVSEYQLTRALPKRLRSVLPSIEEIEAELSTPSRENTTKKPRKRKSR